MFGVKLYLVIQTPQHIQHTSLLIMDSSSYLISDTVKILALTVASRVIMVSMVHISACAIKVWCILFLYYHSQHGACFNLCY